MLTLMFQSPSLRGSGRFPPPKGGGRSVCTSFHSPSLRGSGRFTEHDTNKRLAVRFNPLHCGAVVASGAARRRADGADGVSIPFIAGQWSLPMTDSKARQLHTVFQSPSLRGSGRFLSVLGSCAGAVAGLNPLHCGAVVASFWPHC